jgi:hypothetical protein
MADRTADQIQRDIEAARVSLADTVDQLAYRGNPKRLVEKGRATLLEKLQTPQGKAVAAGVGGLLLLMVVRKIVKR